MIRAFHRWLTDVGYPARPEMLAPYRIKPLPLPLEFGVFVSVVSRVSDAADRTDTAELMAAACALDGGEARGRRAV